MVPFVADNIPVHHWTLRDGRAVGIRHRMACVIEIGAPNRDYGAKDDADKDTHDENSWFPISNAADNGEFPPVWHGRPSNCDSQEGTIWGARR